MDPEYHRYFFMYRNDLKGKKAGDLRSRFKLKSDLKCNSFKWYLDHVFKGKKFIYDVEVRAYGYFRNPSSDLCLDILNRDEEKTNPLGLYSCAPRDESTYTNQVFSLTTTGEIRREETCATANRNQGIIEMSKCVETELTSKEALRSAKKAKKHQAWVHESANSWIKNSGTKECLSTRDRNSGDDVISVPCDPNDPDQKWIIQTYTSRS